MVTLKVVKKELLIFKKIFGKINNGKDMKIVNKHFKQKQRL